MMTSIIFEAYVLDEVLARFLAKWRLLSSNKGQGSVLLFRVILVGISFRLAYEF